jgi:predicted extracellular nuclease
MKHLMAIGVVAAAAGSASAGVYITEFMYQGLNGATQVNFEFFELTNLGAAPVDLTGWSFDDDTRSPGSFSLSSLGVIAPGQSVIVTEATEAAFRARWNLAASVVILGANTNNLGRNDEINIYDASNTLVDRLTYGDQVFAGTVRSNGVSAWAARTDGSGPFGDITTAWQKSVVGDAQNSFAAVAPASDVGSPGSYVPAPGVSAILLGAGLIARRRRA